MLDPRRLLTFRTVAEERSFSRAATALALTQPAVSQQIRALETQAGGTLIERGGGTFELTPLGALLLVHARSLAELLQLAEVQLAEARNEEARALRIGAFPSALAALVPDCVAELRGEIEGFEAGVVQGETPELVDRVRDGSLHLAVCFQAAGSEPSVHTGVRRVELFDEPMVAALSPSHRLAGRTRIRLAELADETWLASDPDGLIRRACVDAGFEPDIAYWTSDPLAIRALVLGGLAVTLAPRLLGESGLRDVAIVRLVDPPRRSVYAVTPPRSTALADRFVDSLRRRAPGRRHVV
jgi:DNA-binding transcriptional LysR family regulator